MSAKPFAGRVALVTGGSRGIGRAVCLALGEAGARVAVNYAANEEAALSVRNELGGAEHDAMTVQADVSRPGDVRRMARAVERALGPIDLLVTSAGVAAIEEHREMSHDEWRRLMAVNVDGTYLPVMAVKDAMIARGYGRIVCLASIAGLRPRPRMIAYGTSKAAVIAFVRNCAPAFAPQIRINAVAPGLIETDMTADMEEALKRSMIAETALERIGRPQDIADTVSFLLSDQSDFMTGQTLVVDGGRVTLP